MYTSEGLEPSKSISKQNDDLYTVSNVKVPLAQMTYLDS